MLQSWQRLYCRQTCCGAVQFSQELRQRQLGQFAAEGVGEVEGLPSGSALLVVKRRGGC
jgi:hypothetical protein